MDWSQGFIAVDWGTTNRRSYRLDADGSCVEQLQDSNGVLAIAAGGFPAAVKEIRSRLGDLPMLLAGMVGSTRGWVEVPYVPCPARLDDLIGGLRWIEAERAAIVPGLAFHESGRWDVMRGEELQLFGAIASGLIPPTALVCHPGTHTKWVQVEDGTIADFRTVMTGELFSLLSAQGILSEFLSAEVQPRDAFREGVGRGLERPILTAELFSIRARILLGSMAREEAASYISGLLIGLDLSVGLDLAEGADIIVMGSPKLARLYRAALDEARLTGKVVDGAHAFIAGAVALEGRIR